MDDDIPFGTLLKLFRLEYGNKKGPKLNQAQMAEKMGVSRGTYNAWENGAWQPPDKDVENIASILKLSQEEEKALYRAKKRTPPAVKTLPPRNTLFIGREAHLKQLDQLLLKGGSPVPNRLVALCGLGGTGKTQLALEYAYRHYGKAYRAVFWVNAESDTTIKADYAKLVNDCLKLPQRDEQNVNHAEVVKVWLEDHTDWLLVMDNVEDLQGVRSFLPQKHSGQIVFTTRLQNVSKLATKIEVGRMEPEEDALLFLLLRSGILKGNDTLDVIDSHIRRKAVELVRLLGEHPLALDQAGAYLEETGASVASYLRLYRAERTVLLNRRGLLGDEHPQPVTVTLELNLKKACEWPSLSGDILRFCSFLQPDAIPEELLRRADSLKSDALSFNEAIGSLQRYSLMKRDSQERLLSMHRLVQETVMNAMPLDLKRQWFLCVQRTLNQADKDLWPEEARLRDKGVIVFNNGPGRSTLLQAETAVMWADGILTNPEGIFTELFLKGEPVFSLEEREQSALKRLEAKSHERLVLAEERYGTENFKIISSLADLADIYGKRGKYEQAECLYERATKIYEQYSETDNISRDIDRFDLLATAPMFHQWAKLAQTQGQYERAIELYEQALTTLSKCWGPNPYALAIKRNYAACLRSIGRDAEAGAVESSQKQDMDYHFTFPPDDDEEADDEQEGYVLLALLANQEYDDLPLEEDARLAVDAMYAFAGVITLD